MKAPVLITPADWHAHMVALAVEAYDRVHERGEPGSLNDVRRERFLVEVRERMAQVAQAVVLEIDLARDAPSPYEPLVKASAEERGAMWMAEAIAMHRGEGTPDPRGVCRDRRTR